MTVNTASLHRSYDNPAVRVVDLRMPIKKKTKAKKTKPSVKKKAAVKKTVSAKKTRGKTAKPKSRAAKAVAAKRRSTATARKKARKTPRTVGLEALEPKRPRGRSGRQAGDLEGL